MNRNTQAHFAKYPSVNIGRSKFDRSFTHKCSFSTGELCPVFVDMDIVPGDTVHMKQAELVRMTTPIAPVMDNIYLDFYWFFIPNRLVMTEWQKLMGENETAPWTQNVDVQIPQIKMSTAGAENNKTTLTVQKGSLYEKMGIPPQNWSYAAAGSQDYKEIKVSALPARAYCLCWNTFFRDENLQNPVTITKSSVDRNLVNTNNGAYTSDPDAYTVQYEERGGLPPLKVCKQHDYFTSCLPGAQKGPAVSIPLTQDRAPLLFGKYYDTTDGEWKTNSNTYGKPVEVDAPTGEFNTTGYFEDGDIPELSLTSNYSLWTDLSKVTGATITQLRQAFAIQKFYERDARGGTRYIESIWSHFGVRNPDYRLQMPEYLGGYRHNINISQVVQNSATDEVSPLGYTGAYSVTTHADGSVFTKSFTEHGILLGLCAVRTDHVYSQGINRAWFKKSRLDFYSPEFANLSEMAVLNREIYAQGTNKDEEAFGYQEAWAEMRYMPDMATGLMRPETGNLGEFWTYADKYTELPSLGDKWIKEPKENVERTLAVTEEDQFTADFYFGAIYTRPMPLYSIPGLIDHH